MNKTKALLAVSAVTFPLAGYACLGKAKRGIARLLVAYAVFFGGRVALGLVETLPVADMVAAAYFAAWAGYALLVVYVIKWVVEDLFAIYDNVSKTKDQKAMPTA
jgi:hypothetical protein